LITIIFESGAKQDVRHVLKTMCGMPEGENNPAVQRLHVAFEGPVDPRDQSSNLSETKLSLIGLGNELLFLETRMKCSYPSNVKTKAFTNRTV
jgi:hypothetical protein